MTDSFAAFACGQLERALPIRTRAMFGCTAVYSRELFFAIVTDDAVYFKVGEANRADYDARGMEPFRPRAGSPVMPYRRVPEDVLEAPDELRRWAERSLDIARSGGR